MFKLGSKAFLAGTTAVVLGVGGAAVAYISATGFGKDKGTVYALSAANQEIRLTLEDPAAVGNPAVFGNGKRLNVRGRNGSAVPLTITNPDEVLPLLTLPEGCPDGSFVVSDPLLTGNEVPPSGRATVGSFLLHFVNDEDEDQAACIGKEIVFVWEGLPTPSTSPTITTTTTTTTFVPTSNV